MEFASAEAEFLKNKRRDELEAQHRRNGWESDTNKGLETPVMRQNILPVMAEYEQHEANGIWTLTTTVGDTETNQEWDVDPQAAEKWGIVEHDWNNNSTTQKTEAFKEGGDESEQDGLGVGIVEKVISWDEDYTSDEEKAQEVSTFGPEAIDGQENTHESGLLQWTTLASETEVCAKGRTEKPTEHEKVDCPCIHDDDDDDEQLFPWVDLNPTRINTNKDEPKNFIASNPDKSESSSLPTPPPSPRPSPLPEKPELPFDQAWKQIGRILADVHFEEHMAAWGAATKALGHHLRSRSDDCRVHRANRSPEVRDAETIWPLRRTRDSARAFNVVVLPDDKRTTAEAVATGRACTEVDVPICLCLCGSPRGEEEEGDEEGSLCLGSEEDLLSRCPFNRRLRRRRVAGDGLGMGSRLRQSLAMRELQAGGVAEEDFGIRRLVIGVGSHLEA